MSRIFKVVRNENEDSSENSISKNLKSISGRVKNLLGNKRAMEDEIKTLNLKIEEMVTKVSTEIKHKELLQSALDKIEIIRQHELESFNKKMYQRCEQVGDLEKTIVSLKEENEDIVKENNGLKEEILNLKELYMGEKAKTSNLNKEIDEYKLKVKKEKAINEYFAGDNMIRDIEKISSILKDMNDRIS